MKNDGMALDVPLISGRYARRFLRFVQKHGITGTIVLDGSGIDSDMLDNPDAYLSMRQIQHLLHNGNRLLNDPTAPFRFGQELDLHGHGLFGFALLRQRDYRKLVTMVVQYLRVSLPLMDMEIHCTGELISIRLHDNWDLKKLKPMVANIYMGSIHALASLVCRKFTFEFDFDCPGNSLAWQRLADGVATYLAAARSREQIQGDASLKVVIKVRHEIMNSPGRDSTLERVSQKLGMSPRSVRRHLGLAGFAFSGIRNDIRETFASRYLLETDMPLEKIADQLGYSDQASFSKAYRSWTGRTPGEVRRTSRPDRN